MSSVLVTRPCQQAGPLLGGCICVTPRRPGLEKGWRAHGRGAASALTKWAPSPAAAQSRVPARRRPRGAARQRRGSPAAYVPRRPQAPGRVSRGRWRERSGAGRASPSPFSSSRTRNPASLRSAGRRGALPAPQRRSGPSGGGGGVTAAAGSEGKGCSPSILRAGYSAILDPRDKKIHAVSPAPAAPPRPPPPPRSPPQPSRGPMGGGPAAARSAAGLCRPGAVPPGFRLLLSPRGAGGTRGARARSAAAGPARPAAPRPPPRPRPAGAAGSRSRPAWGRGRGPAALGPRIPRGRRSAAAARSARSGRLPSAASLPRRARPRAAWAPFPPPRAAATSRRARRWGGPACAACRRVPPGPAVGRRRAAGAASRPAPPGLQRVPGWGTGWAGDTVGLLPFTNYLYFFFACVRLLHSPPGGG